MSYKQAKNYLKNQNVVLMFAPVSKLSISFTGEPTVAMIQPDRCVKDTKRAAIELKKRKKCPRTYHSTRATKNIQFEDTTESGKSQLGGF